ESHRSLAEYGKRVFAGQPQPPNPSVGRSRSASDGRSFLERKLVGKRHVGVCRHLHVLRVSAVARNAVRDDPFGAELRPADATMAAYAAAGIVVVHHALPDLRLLFRNARPDRSDDPAWLVTGNDRPFRRDEPH